MAKRESNEAWLARQPKSAPDAGIRNATHFMALGACMALKTLKIELEAKTTGSLKEVLTIIDRRILEHSTEDTEVKA